MPAYQDVYRRSIEDPEGFWLVEAGFIDWDAVPSTALDSTNAPFHRWFPDGRLNTCHNALDRWVEAGHADRIALGARLTGHLVASEVHLRRTA